jgi:hypothetical protein
LPQSMPFGASFSFDTARRNPEHPRRRERINGPSLPLGEFVSDAMDVSVMDSAQTCSELVADLEAHPPRGIASASEALIILRGGIIVNDIIC